VKGSLSIIPHLNPYTFGFAPHYGTQKTRFFQLIRDSFQSCDPERLRP